MAYIGRTPTNAALTASDLADGIVSTAKIAADAVTDAKIADDVVGTEHLTANEVDTTALGADAVTGAQLADDAVNSEHYTDGSIDTAHIADANVTTAKIADDAVTAAKINNDIISGTTALASEPADTDEFLVSDAGTLKRIDYSLIKGSGKIAQVVSASTTSAVTITSGSFTDSGITANITPSATSSKILILISAAVLMHGNGRTSSIAGVNILRDSTEIYGGGNNNAMGIYTENNTGVKMWAGHSHTFLDSPSSTSQITYKMQGRIETSGESMTFQLGGMNSVITLMEVLA